MNRHSEAHTLRNQKGLTLVELLITIGVGSVVITMLMSILSTTLLTKNMADHENRLLDESYFISEYIQNQIFDLGVRSIEDISPENSDDQIFRLNHEYEVKQRTEDGLIFRDYSEAKSYILHYDASQKSLHYGTAAEFDDASDAFIDPALTRINSEQVNVVNVEEVPTLEYVCIANGEFKSETKCASAIIQLNITLDYIINDNSLFDPIRFESTIVF